MSSRLWTFRRSLEAVERQPLSKTAFVREMTRLWGKRIPSYANLLADKMRLAGLVTLTYEARLTEDYPPKAFSEWTMEITTEGKRYLRKVRLGQKGGYYKWNKVKGQNRWYHGVNNWRTFVELNPHYGWQFCVESPERLPNGLLKASPWIKCKGTTESECKREAIETLLRYAVTE